MESLWCTRSLHLALQKIELFDLLRALGELRIPCPERVSVLGFDDFDWTSLTPDWGKIDEQMRRLALQDIASPPIVPDL